MLKEFKLRFVKLELAGAEKGILPQLQVQTFTYRFAPPETRVFCVPGTRVFYAPFFIQDDFEEGRCERSIFYFDKEDASQVPAWHISAEPVPGGVQFNAKRRPHTLPNPAHQ